MQIKRHMSLNLQGLLNNYRKRKINFIDGDDGKRLSDTEARKSIAVLLAKGHKLISCSNECVGFDPFGGGCPGHPIEDTETTN
jgi:hypothetical protein